MINPLLPFEGDAATFSCSGKKTCAEMLQLTHNLNLYICDTLFPFNLIYDVYPSRAFALARLQCRSNLIKEMAFLIFKKGFCCYDGLRAALLNPLLSSWLHEDECCVHDAVGSWRGERQLGSTGSPGWCKWPVEWGGDFNTESVLKQTLLLISAFFPPPRMLLVTMMAGWVSRSAINLF